MQRTTIRYTFGAVSCVNVTSVLREYFIKLKFMLVLCNRELCDNLNFCVNKFYIKPKMPTHCNNLQSFDKHKQEKDQENFDFNLFSLVLCVVSLFST